MLVGYIHGSSYAAGHLTRGRSLTCEQINTMTTDQHPSGYIVSNADDLLHLFDADYGMLVVGQGAKILGPNHNSQEILVLAEYLRLKQFKCVHSASKPSRY